MQIILLLIVILLVLLIVAIKKDSISSLNKLYIGIIVLVIVSSIIAYQSMFSKYEKHNRELINAYKQGKTLICNQNEVNNVSFRLETGTQSFVAKREKKELKGIIHDIGDCTLKE